MATDVKLNVTSAGMFNSFREKELQLLQKKAEKIKQLGVNVVACREGIDDSVKKILVESGIQAYRRVAKSDLNLLAKACNGILVNRIEDAGQKDLGNFESSNNISADGKDLWVLSSTGCGVTIVAKGSTVDVVGEVERCLDDALGALYNYMKITKFYAAAVQRMLRWLEHCGVSLNQCQAESN